MSEWKETELGDIASVQKNMNLSIFLDGTKNSYYYMLTNECFLITK